VIMNHETDVCLTYETALQAAINMENRVYHDYLEALRIVRDQAAREILQEAALAKLNYKHILEKAALGGSLDELAPQGPVSVMNLTVHCCDQHRSRRPQGAGLCDPDGPGRAQVLPRHGESLQRCANGKALHKAR